MDKSQITLRLKILLVCISLLSLIGVYFRSYYLNFVGFTNAQGANPTPDPLGTTWCTNNEGAALTADTSIWTDEYAPTWEECWSWCNKDRMTQETPLCYWEGTSTSCQVQFAPTGGLNECIWEVGAPPYGGYIGMDVIQSSPTGPGMTMLPPIFITPTPDPSGITFCENHGSVSKTAPSSIFDSDLSWNACKTWCLDNMTVDDPLCQWNGDVDTCWINFPPAGGIETCNWIVDGDGAPPYGWYLEAASPTPTPTLEPAPTPTPTTTPVTTPPPWPELTMTSYTTGSTIHVLTNDSVNISGYATDSDSVIDVSISTNGVDWTYCPPDDGVFSQSPEYFTCVVSPPSAGGTKTIDIKATDGLGNTTSSNEYVTYTLSHDSEPQSNELAHWNMDDKEYLVDQTGLHSNGIPNQEISRTDRTGTGDALHFNGVSSYTIPDDQSVLSFDGANKSFTIDFWVKPGTTNGYQTLISKTDGSQSSRWEIGIDQENQVYIAVYNDTRSALGEDEPKAQLTEGEWNHVIARFDSNDGLAIKVNNNQEAYNGFSYKQQLLPSTGTILIAKNALNENFFTGDLDDIIITNGGDADAPFVNVTPLETPERVTSTPTFNITITDHKSNIASVEYLFYPGHAGSNIDGETWQQITTPSDGAYDENEEEASIVAPELADGTWYLFIRATDTLGHKNLYNNDGYFAHYGYSTISNMSAYRFVMEAHDTTAPKIYAHAVIPMETTDTMPSVRGYVKDYKYEHEGDSYTNITTVQYRLNGGSWINIDALDGIYNSPFEEFNVSFGSLAPGTYTLDIRAIDAQGNDTNDQPVESAYQNYTEEFTIIAPRTDVSVEKIIREENFTTHDLQDTLFTNGIWGNGRARLKQTMTFTDTQRLYTTTDDFGFEFGGVNVNVFPSADGNVWVATNYKDLLYFNKTSNTTTRYSHTTLQNGEIAGVKDFIYNEQHYVFVYYTGTYPTMLINTNNTLENTSDDTIVNLSDTANINQYLFLRPFAIDTRGGGLAVFAVLMNSGADPDNFIVRIDTKGTIMDFSDDTFMLWGRAQGLALTDGETNFYQDFTAQYFDQSSNKLLLGSYNYGLFVCDDGGTLDNHSDDQCFSHGNNPTSLNLFSIDKDENGSYWLGGDYGIDRVDIHGTADQSDDTWQDVINPSDISNETVAHVKWIAGVDPVGAELFFFTREGHIRALEYNSTYTDTLDDTAYDHRVPFIEYHAGGAVGFYMEDRNTIWIAAQARGLYSVNITRDYDTNNVLEFLPTPPQGILQINFITLNSVLGSVSAGSSSSFQSLVQYEVSNDDGLSWQPIVIGQTVKFTTAGYKLKFRITMTKGSTPVINYVKLSYVAYPTNVIPDNPPGDGGIGGGGTTITNTLPPSCNQELPGAKAPHLYAAIPDGATSIKLYFTDADGPMDQYVLVYGNSSNNYTMGALRMGSQGIRTFTVSELRPFRTYYFRMRAMNGCAPGPWSNEIFAKTRLVSNPLTKNEEDAKETSKTIVAKLPSYSKAEQQIIVPKPVNVINITTNTSSLLILRNILLFMIAILLFFIFFILFYKKRKKKQTQLVD